MSRIKLVLLVISVSCCTAFSGCRSCPLFNRGCQPACSPTIAPPSTYSLQPPIGALGQAQPYYNGAAATTARQPGYLVNPNAPAPTPATNTPNLAPPNGWRPVGGNGYSNTGVAPQANPARPSTTQMASVLQPSNGQPSNGQANTASATQTNPATPTGVHQNPGFVAGNTPAQPAGPRFASNTSFNNTLGLNRSGTTGNTGTSVIESNNYRSTSVDERTDQSRLAATNASNVRAPSGVRTASASGVLNARQPNVQTQQPYPYPQQYSPAPRLAGVQPGIVYNAPRVAAVPGYNTYQATPQFANGTYNAYPVLAGNSYPANRGLTSQGVVASQGIIGNQGVPMVGTTTSAPTLLGQSTVTFDPNSASSSYDNGWRDRDFTTRR